MFAPPLPLRRAALAFARWAEDPLSHRLMQESVQRKRSTTTSSRSCRFAQLA